MAIRRGRWLAGAMLAMTTGWVQAAAPLDPDALRQCAAQVQQLRQEAVQLNARTAALDERRQSLDLQSEELRNEAAQLDRNDLPAGLALQQRRTQNSDQKLAFNAEIVQHRQAINAINEVKRQYAGDCADRPYRRADLERLPADAQAAMRAGLDDIEVPYLDPAASP